MGTYNYSARELADEINELLNNLEGDFEPGELKKALRLVAVEHGVEPTRPNVGAGADFSYMLSQQISKK